MSSATPPCRPLSSSGCLTYAASKSWRLFVGCVIANIVIAIMLRAVLGSVQTLGEVSGAAKKEDIKQGSLLADILAYNIIAIIYATYTSYVGVRAWYGGGAAAVGSSLMHRLYAHSEPMERLCIATTAYEFYNSLATVWFPEYRTAAFIGHHLTTLLLGVLSLHPFLHYYAIFFFGVASTSSIPLCLGEVFNAIGSVAARDACQAVFAISFLAIRTCYWPYVSAGFWRDSLEALSKRSTHVHSLAAFSFLLVSNIGLTTLQFVWTGQILTAIASAIG
uniref:TLC domain-containing protein n=1 Tax=Haptolina ericina TaxID=156174 RepID=A0A7S3AH86_9EUKA|mmetsp:Transcript_17242/g.38687  ORF Transcript_17242/g.38687 Transcript_17242/m.38687 type:complete len:277 (+) Transcript_17242:77-907(+)